MNESPGAGRRLVLAIVGSLFSLITPSLARGEQRDDPGAPSSPSRVQETTRAGGFLPLTLPASVGRSHVFAAAYGGYDSAVANGRLVSFAEARIYGPLALRVGVQSSGVSQRIAPSFAGRVEFLSEAKHGLDAAASVAYNAEGFTEFEGEIEVVLAIGKTLGNWQLLTNLAYGQDGEGEERDGEFRAAALCRLGRIYYLGFDGRGRVDLGSDPAKLSAHQESLYDIDVGPVLNLALGPVVLGAHAGFSAVEHVGGETRFGAVALAGLGSVL